MKLLLAEDQKVLNKLLKDRLTEKGYVVKSVFDGHEALISLESEEFDILILDIMMPVHTGIDILNIIRPHNTTPAILLTAKDKIEDRVKGLEAGADDYLIKPFAFEELVARINALSRRKHTQFQSLYRCEYLSVDPLKKRVYVMDEPIEITRKEYLIIEYLIKNINIVVSRELLESITTEHEYESNSNVIDVYIKMIRKKIEFKTSKRIIHTVRGFGYVLKDNT